MTKLKKIFFVLLCTALFLTGCSEEAQDTDKPVQSENQTAETKKPQTLKKRNRKQNKQKIRKKSRLIKKFPKQIPRTKVKKRGKMRKKRKIPKKHRQLL